MFRCLLICLTIAGSLFLYSCAKAQDQTADALERYEQAVNTILVTTRDEERQYIAALFDLVKSGELPKEFIDRSIQWVRQRRPRSKYRIIYFDRILRLHAEQLQIDLPPFDLSTYQPNQ